MRLGGRGKAGRFGELGGKEMIGRRRTEKNRQIGVGVGKNKIRRNSKRLEGEVGGLGKIRD